MTELAAGSLAILGFDGREATPTFAFTLLTDVEAGTVVYFTDVGVLSNGTSFANFEANEGVTSWTASRAYSAGETIDSIASAAEFAPVVQFSAGNATAGMDLSNTGDTVGDQLIAFQADLDAGTFRLENVRFLFAIQTSSDTWATGEAGTDPTDVNQSAVPAGLVDGQTALALGGSGGIEDGVSFVGYRGPTTGTAAGIQEELADKANWSSDAADYPGSTFAVPSPPFTVTDATGNANPAITAPVGLATDEDTSVLLTGLSVDDPENDTVTVEINAAGNLSVGTPGSTTVTGDGSASVSIEGTEADVNAALASLFLLPEDDFAGTVTVEVIARDKSAAFTRELFDVGVTAVDDSPEIAEIAPTITFTDQMIAAGQQVLFETPAITDPDSPNFAGGELSLSFTSGGSADDELRIVSTFSEVALPGEAQTPPGIEIVIDEEVDGPDPDLTGKDVTVVYYQNSAPVRVIIGSVTAGGKDGGPLTVSLNGNASHDYVELLLQAVRYSNDSTAPSTRDLQISLQDGTTSAAATVTQTIDIVSANDAPVLTDLAANVIIDPADLAGGPQPVDSDVTLTDSDSTDFDGGRLVITVDSPRDQTDEQLSFVDAGGITIAGTSVSFGGNVIGTISSDGTNGADLVVDLVGTDATPAAVEALIEALRYDNTGTDPEGTRSISIQVEDGDGGASTVQTVSVDLVTPPDPPEPDDFTVTFVEESDAIFIDDEQSSSVTDPDPETFSGGTLTATINGGVTTEDSLGIVPRGDISLFGNTIQKSNAETFAWVGSYTVDNDGPGDPTLTVQFFNFISGVYRPPTAEEVERIAQTFTYLNTNAADPDETDRTVVFEVVDSASAPQTVGTFTVDIEAIEDAPVLVTTSSGTSFDFTAATAAPQLLGAIADLGDVDSPDLAGGSFRIENRAGGLAGDQLTIRDSGTPGTGVEVSGGTVSFDGNVVGTVVGGANGADLVVTFTTAAATPDSVETILGAVQYQNTAGLPETTRTFTFEVFDEEGVSSGPQPFWVSLTDTPTPKPPVIADLTAERVALRSEVNAGPILIDDSVTITDLDSADFDGGSFVVGYQTPRGTTPDQLSILSTGTATGISVSGNTVSFDGTVIGTITSDGVNGNALSVQLSGAAATPAAVSALAEAIQYGTTDTLAEGTVGLFYRLSDGDGQTSASVPVNVTVRVDGIANPDTATTAEDNDASIALTLLLANDTGFNSSAAVTSVQSAVNGTVQIVGSNAVFSPDLNFNGTGSFTYTVNDGEFTETAQVDVTVTPVNDAPTALDDDLSATEDTVRFGSVLFDNGNGADFDLDGDSISAVAMTTTSVQGGSVTLRADGAFSYFPARDFFGIDSFDYTVTDGTLTDVGTVTFTVAPINDRPIGVDDTIAGTEDVQTTGNVLVDNGNGADSDVDSSPLGTAAETLTSAQGGTVVIDSNGNFTYDGPENFNGTDSFDYTVTDGSLTDTATVTLQIAPVNDAPVLFDDTFSATEDTRRFGSVFYNNGAGADFDIEGSPLSAGPLDGVTTGGGTIRLLANGAFTYRPAPDFNGVDTFVYTASDGDKSSNATITFNVAPTPDAPTSVNDTIAGTEDIPLNGDVLADNGNGADFDVDGDSVSAVAATIATAEGGSVDLRTDGTFTYTGRANFNGSDSFEYTITDGALVSEPATVTLQIAPANDAPVAIDDGVTAPEDEVIFGNVLANNGIAADFDIDGDPLSITPGTITTAQGGRALLVADGRFIYQSAADFNGTDSFTYTLSDGTATDTGTVFVTVTPVNDRPVAIDDVFAATAGTPRFGSVLWNNGAGADFDPEGDPISAVREDIAGSQGGRLQIIPNGAFTYTPADGFAGSESFVYTITDGALTDEGEVRFNVSAPSRAAGAEGDPGLAVLFAGDPQTLFDLDVA